VALNRPARANAYDSAMLTEFGAFLDSARADARCRAVVITGSGDRSFCAGADLSEVRGRRAVDALDLQSAALFRRLAALPLVTIAAVNGTAVGGGLELALACDVRLASAHARFWFPEPLLGLIPAAGGTQRLARAVGVAAAKELILAGREWNAAEALRRGLVSEVLPGKDLLAAAAEWAARIASRDPLALRLAKTAIDLDTGEAGLAYEAAAEALLYERRIAAGGRAVAARPRGGKGT
jgi:enoyl-CoA hydratase/carnithine racemase